MSHIQGNRSFDYNIKETEILAGRASSQSHKDLSTHPTQSFMYKTFTCFLDLDFGVNNSSSLALCLPTLKNIAVSVAIFYSQLSCAE